MAAEPKPTISYFLHHALTGLAPRLNGARGFPLSSPACRRRGRSGSDRGWGLTRPYLVGQRRTRFSLCTGKSSPRLLQDPTVPDGVREEVEPQDLLGLCSSGWRFLTCPSLAKKRKRLKACESFPLLGWRLIRLSRSSLSAWHRRRMVFFGLPYFCRALVSMFLRGVSRRRHMRSQDVTHPVLGDPATCKVSSRCPGMSFSYILPLRSVPARPASYLPASAAAVRYATRDLVWSLYPVDR